MPPFQRYHTNAQESPQPGSAENNLQNRYALGRLPSAAGYTQRSQASQASRRPPVPCLGPPALPEPAYPVTVTQTRLSTSKFLGDQRSWTADNQPSAFVVGDVIRFSHFAYSMNSGDAAHHRVQTDAGFVCPKLRLGIVMQISEEELQVCPVFSSGGNGVSFKTDAYKWKSVGLFNMLKQPKEEVAAMFPHKLLVSGSWNPTTGSHLKLSNVYTIPLMAPIGKAGSLTDPGRIKLKQLLYEAGIAGRLPINQQQAASERAMKRLTQADQSSSLHG